MTRLWHCAELDITWDPGDGPYCDTYGEPKGDPDRHAQCGWTT